MIISPAPIFPPLFICISLFGLFILPILIFKNQIYTVNLSFQKELIGIVFSAICILGGLAAIKPSLCSHLFSRKSRFNSSTILQQTSIRYRGHHPTCKNFSSHTLQIKGKIFCAGCTGLIIGTLVAFIGNFMYFFLNFNLGGNEVLVFWLGLVGVGCGFLFYHLFKLENGLLRSILNILFVVGVLSLILGIYEITGSLIIEVYLLLLIIFWLMTRIVLSQYQHKKICRTCTLAFCTLI